MEYVDILYSAPTEFQSSVPVEKFVTKKGVKKKRKLLVDQPVEKAPPKKKVKYFDLVEQREKIMTVTFHKESNGKYYARKVPKEVAEKINKAKNYKLIERKEAKPEPDKGKTTSADK